MEAIRVRKEPGPWTGKKGSRVATAAISAGVIGAATDTKHKAAHGESDKMGKIGSAIGGLLVNRAVNGPRKELRS